MKAALLGLAVRASDQWRRGGVRNLVRGGLAGIVATLTNRALTIVSAMLLARLLGTDGYGIYAFAIATMMILTIVSEFGMYMLLVREVSSAHARDDWGALLGLRREAISFALLLSGAIGALGAVVLWLTPLVPDPTERLALTLVLILLPINTMVRLGSAILSGLRRLASAQTAELVLFPAMLVAGLLAIYVFHGPVVLPQTALMAQIGAGVCATAIIFFIVHRAFGPGRDQKAISRRPLELRRLALPFLLIGAGASFTQQIDTVIISIFMSHADTAHYRVAAQAATLTWFGAQILQAISAPYFSRFFHQQDYRSLARLYYVANALAVLAALPVVVIFALFGRALIALTFGPEFTDAQPLLMILSVGYLLNVACGPAGSLLVMSGEERLASWVLLCMTAGTVALSLILVKVAGPMGVAFATAGGVAGYQLALRIFIKRRFGF